jgi:beta-glucosidase
MRQGSRRCQPKQKPARPKASSDVSTRAGIKVFWFFSSEKNNFLKSIGRPQSKRKFNHEGAKPRRRHEGKIFEDRDIGGDLKAAAKPIGSHALIIAVSGIVHSAALAGGITEVTGNARVDRLLSRMTLAEKLTLIHDGRDDSGSYQGQAGFIGGTPRLNIPGLRLADGPPGVLTRHPSQAETATMGVAATFDVGLAQLNGVVIGREARALGIDVALQPYVNIDRDLTFKRAYNTFGEDPLLTSRMGAAEIRGIQSQHVMAVAKHFVGFDTAATNVWIDEQALHEIYLAPFEAAIEAGVAGVMCAYNHVNGPYACGNEATLETILRGQLGFKGFVTSDWGATHSALFMNEGLDVEMIDGPDSAGYQEPAFLGAEAAASAVPNGDPQGDLYGGQIPEETAPAPADAADLGLKVAPKTIAEALKDGSVTEATVTRAAGRVLVAMDRFGLLSGGSKHGVTQQSIEANARIIERTAEEAAVLLKNDGDMLPLKPADLASVVLIGPTAGQVDAIGISGERSLGLPERQIGPLDAMKSIAHNQNIRYAVDDDMTGAPIPAGVLSHAGRPGLERVAAGARQIDAAVNFTVNGGNPLPADSSAVWTGSLTVPEAGEYWIYLQALGAIGELMIDGKAVGSTGAYPGDVHGDILQPNQDNVLPTTDGLDNLRCAMKLTAGAHALRLRIRPDTSHAPAQLRLNWYTPRQRLLDHAAAIEAARLAKAAVVFVWSRRAPAFALAGDQDRLVEEVAAVNPNTTVVLNTSQPVALPWASRVKAILQMWWPGDEGGWATAKLLLGKSNPAGRLPVTWAKALDDYAASNPHYPERSSAGVGGKTMFGEGVNVGYRWFDLQRVAPLFPFGYGQSYTSFDYSGLKIAMAGDGGIDLSARICNSGHMDGDEVPQVYLGAPADQVGGVQFPVRTLATFDRVFLKAGQAKTVRMHVPLRQLQSWSAARHQWVEIAGKRMVSLGASSRDIRLQQEVSVPEEHSSKQGP